MLAPGHHGAEMPDSQQLTPSSSGSEDYIRLYHGEAHANGVVTALPVPNAEADIDVEYNQLLVSLPDFERPQRPQRRTISRTNSESSFSRFSKAYLLSPKKWMRLGRKKKPKPKTDGYIIEYSVFKPIQYLTNINDEHDLQAHFLDILRREGYNVDAGELPPNYIDKKDFMGMVSAITHDVEHDSDLKPMRISQGSSGSYFILGKESTGSEVTYSQRIIKKGIFKPKDEEPYGPLSPKWSKWLHRTFFPCFFGRSCLIPNLGYISEAAACVLDRQLQSYIVPYTDVIYLRSPQFYYSFWSRRRSRREYKIGSFQMFLHGYVEAQTFFKTYPFPQIIEALPESSSTIIDAESLVEASGVVFRWSLAVVTQFQEELEKLVILDYIMRNTDRGADNWMIKIEWIERPLEHGKKEVYPFLKIGAIDSGLAFPWKHPDEWRSFPFGWLFLPLSLIGQPFSTKTRQHYLPLLTSKYWWEQTVPKLKQVFQQDADFKERMWLKQLAVLKGQALNVVEVLKHNNAGPLELTRRESLLIWDDAMTAPVLIDNNVMANAMESSIYDMNTVKRNLWGDSAGLQNERTPLLNVPETERRLSATSLTSTDGHPRQMSGFEYNESYEGGEEEQTTRTVVIERLEKLKSKPPVFTWC